MIRCGIPDFRTRCEHGDVRLDSRRPKPDAVEGVGHQPILLHDEMQRAVQVVEERGQFEVGTRGDEVRGLI